MHLKDAQRMARKYGDKNPTQWVFVIIDRTLPETDGGPYTWATEYDLDTFYAGTPEADIIWSVQEGYY